MQANKLNNIKVGDFYEEFVIVSCKLIEAYAGLLGDKNPIHLDKVYAEKTRFKKRIAHGMLVGGFISKVIGMDFPGEGTVYLKQELEFLKPVYIDDKIMVRVEVIEQNEETNRLTLETICRNLGGETLVKGKALVLLPK